MALTRREFLAGAAALSAVRSAGSERGGRTAEPESAACLVAPPVRDGLQREWFNGYQRALEVIGVPQTHAVMGSPVAARLVILSAAAVERVQEFVWIKSLAARGSTVLVETAAAFLPRQAQERQALLAERHLGIRLRPARRLWDEGEARAGLPYVELTWPVVARIRDYSSWIGVSGGAEAPLAVVEGLPCAVRKRLGAGTLLFLGSPVGPHLWAEDREALHWFRSLCSSCSLG